uniref:Dna mismatch repair protein msh6-2 n=1 Tax=Tetraselmis sp. GSL018 TaxID=582737 RepID=A0A061S473_9CHLO
MQTSLLKFFGSQGSGANKLEVIHFPVSEEQYRGLKSGVPASDKCFDSQRKDQAYENQFLTLEQSLLFRSPQVHNDVPIADVKTLLKERLELGSSNKQILALQETRQRFRWLAENFLRDGHGRAVSHKDFDTRTIQVPSTVFEKLSDSQKQYWAVKKDFRDVVLFFKVGKFYELYEDDAEIGREVLDWKMTVTGVGHCRQVGCPESGIDEACSRLLAAGYKVARMEQMETGAEAKARRGPRACIRRELQPVVTPATATDGLEDGAAHLLALAAPERDGPAFGFAFADAAAGHVFLGSLSDDGSLSSLSSLLAQLCPKEVLVKRGELGADASRLVARSLRDGASLSRLTPGDEFPDPPAAAGALESSGVWGPRSAWPEALERADDSALAALAALTAHLRRLRADAELLGKCSVRPFDIFACGSAVRLDGPTIGNLELLEGAEGGRQGSLLARMDSCISPGGRRLLRAWLCRPLRSVALIERRLDAVEELMHAEFAQEFASELRGLPDLERALGRLRRLAAAALPLDMARQRQLQRSKALAAAAVAVKQASRVLATLGPAESTLLAQAARQRPIAGADDGALAALDAVLAAFALPDTVTPRELSKLKSLELTDDALARVSGAEPEAGLEEGACRLRREAAATSALADALLRHMGAWEAMSEAISTADVLLSFAWFASCAGGPCCRPQVLPPGSGAGGKAILDVRELWHPCAVPPDGGGGGQVVPNDFALGRRNSTVADGDESAMDSGGVGWVTGIKRARGLEENAGDMHGAAVLSEARALLLTGPNMGGKSTLLRATCLAAVLAQVGCYVPARYCRLSAVDAIFTRVGASDRLMSGQSTFAVECSETSAILRSATADSLVVLDELGRGTSTFDGYAIAGAVLRHLVDTVDCRLLFATHYHGLTTEFEAHPGVELAHMAALVGGVSTAANRRDSTASSRQLPPSHLAETDITFCLHWLVPKELRAAGGRPRRDSRNGEGVRRAGWSAHRGGRAVQARTGVRA